MKEFLNLIISNQARKAVLFPLGFLMVMAMIIMPLPPWMLDVLFSFNISFAILVLIRSTTVTQILQFAIFPVLLLFGALLRLMLNVASTRAVLSEGHNGPDAAGKVIESFGNVVVGGSYSIGFTIFLILIVINFMVVTRGMERLAQVGARFSLDALPVRLMGVENEMQAGLIDQEEATRKRQQVTKESELGGKFDGAANFIKGDVIAGLVITALNLIAGVAIGTLEHGISALEAFQTYGLLTIGDGVVAQIPSLILSISAGILVSRITDGETTLTESMGKQMGGEPLAPIMAGGILLIMAIVPGMPHLAFSSAAVGLFFLGWFMTRTGEETVKTKIDPASLQVKGDDKALNWGVIPYVLPIKIELGFKLISLIAGDKTDPFMKSIRGSRKTISEQVGFLLPDIEMGTNHKLKNTEYSIMIDGDLIEKGQVFPDHLMTIGIPPGDVSLDGIQGQDPAHRLPVLWIKPESRSKAIARGYRVIAVHDVIATHVAKVCRQYLSKLFNYDDVLAMNERLAMYHPQLAEKLTQAIEPNLQMQVMRQLLLEQVPITNVRAIANTLIESVQVTKDPIMLASDIRVELSRTIMSLISPNEKVISTYSLKEETTQLLGDLINQAKGVDPNVRLDQIPVTNEFQQQMLFKMPEMVKTMRVMRLPAVLLTPAHMRPLLSKLARTYAPGLIVLSFNEVPVDYKINEVEKV